MAIATFTQSAFDAFIVENKVIGFFDTPITLKSGRRSNWYVNWRSVSEDAFRLDLLTDFVVAFIEDAVVAKSLSARPDCIYGVPEGATKIAVVAQLKWAKRSPSFGPGSHAVPMGRGHPKEHGAVKDRYFLGSPRGRTVVLEDVTTTGGSLLTTLAALRESNIDVVAAIGLTNRMERRDDGRSVAEAIQAMGVKYLHMSSAVALLPTAAGRESPSEKILREIEQEFQEVGVEQIRFGQ